MAKRWSFEEDYIICKFAFKYTDYLYIQDDFDYLMFELKELGFANRSAKAVEKRVRDYQLIFSGENAVFATKQVREIANAYMTRPERSICLEGTLTALNPIFAHGTSESFYQSDLFGLQTSHLNQFVAVAPIAPSFKDVLCAYIRKSGLSDAEVYSAAYVSRDKFNHIINGRKGKKVKPDEDGHKVNASQRTVMQLCIGLKLNLKDSVRLMACAGYAFRPNDERDLVVAECLRQGIRNIVNINVELYERGLELFKNPKE